MGAEVPLERNNKRVNVDGAVYNLHQDGTY